MQTIRFMARSAALRPGHARYLPLAAAMDRSSRFESLCIATDPFTPLPQDKKADMLFQYRLPYPRQKHWPAYAAWPDIPLIVLDMDDNQLARPFRRVEDRRHFTRMIAEAHLLTVSTPALAQALRPLHDHILLLPNQYPFPLAPLPQRQMAGRVRILYAGLRASGEDMDCLPALNAALAALGEEVEFHVLCNRKLFEALQTPHKTYSDAVPHDKYSATIQSADILWLPLTETAFNRCKSDIKFLDAAAHGAAALASATVYERCVTDNETGLIYRGPEDLQTQLIRLVRDPELRETLRQNARRYLVQERLFGHYAADYSEAFWQELQQADRLKIDREKRLTRLRQKGVIA